MLLVALRLTIGWHFFYEGVWKITNSDEFSATPFLTMSKGPFAPLFYAMVPDLDGRVRLATGPVADEKKAEEGWVTSPVYLAAWMETKDQFKSRNRLSEEQAKTVDEKFRQYEVSLEEFMTDTPRTLPPFRRLGPIHRPKELGRE